MPISDAQRYLKSRIGVVFDRQGHTKISWSVQDAYSVRVVLYELDRLQQLVAEGYPK